MAPLTVTPPRRTPSRLQAMMTACKKVVLCARPNGQWIGRSIFDSGIIAYAYALVSLRGAELKPQALRGRLGAWAARAPR